MRILSQLKAYKVQDLRQTCKTFANGDPVRTYLEQLMVAMECLMLRALWLPMRK